MSGTLAIQDGKLIMQGGKLGFCCCPGGCQWFVRWTYSCGTCSDGSYGAKGWSAGIAEKITDPAFFLPPGDYLNTETGEVMRYGRNPAEGAPGIPACGESPAVADLDTATEPTIAAPPCFVIWRHTYGKLRQAGDGTGHYESCEDCLAAAAGMDPDIHFADYAGTDGEEHPAADPDMEPIPDATPGGESQCHDNGISWVCASWETVDIWEKLCP